MLECKVFELSISIFELLKGPKKVHYLVCFSKIDTLKLDLSVYSWKGGEPLFFFTIALRRKMLKDSKPKINVVEKKWVRVLPFTFKLKWTKNWCKMWNRKNVGFM